MRIFILLVFAAMPSVLCVRRPRVSISLALPLCLFPRRTFSIRLAYVQIAQELEHNPFMRVDAQAVREATGSGDAVGAMKQLREMKNSFRPPPETPGRFPAL